MPAAPSTSDWLELCRAATADIDEVLERLPTRDEREPVLRAGEGGDDTTAIDAAAEEVLVRHLDALGIAHTLVSEELGTRVVGDGSGPRVVVDPIDGSVNAKRGIPYFSFSLAVADGDTMDDVTFGFVHDFGSGEEWWAERGSGAFLDDAPLTGPVTERARSRSSRSRGRPHLSSPSARPHMIGVAERLRVMGSLALSLCHLAAGRVDARLLPEARAVDRHRCGAAARPRARPRDRALRGSAVRCREARSRSAQPAGRPARTPELCTRLATALR